MKTLKEFVNEKLEESAHEMDRAIERHAKWREAAEALENDEVVSDSITDMYWRWRGMQPSER